MAPSHPTFEDQRLFKRSPANAGLLFSMVIGLAWWLVALRHAA